ncbi:hypothetical protein PS838_01231 [Pseudomonas fluorescens]|nr:hypothetical protein PS838_01231 [Pseudomonas fluorescens]
MSVKSNHENDTSFPIGWRLNDILEAMPGAIYTTDAKGLITFFNTAAAELWGVKPQLGKSEFCGSWRLFSPNGDPLPHRECPLAITLKEQRPLRGQEIVVERPDGTRVRLHSYPSPIFAANGKLLGAVNTLVDLSEQTMADESSARHNAIVESSDDAIIAKDLNGTITNWNLGAQHLFGYTADEVVGKSVTMLIPLDRKDEEPDILRRIRNGERIEHYETVRRRKDGSLVEISLSVSPIRNREGHIIGAAKIARDITERRKAETQKDLLLREMDHRVKNLFALANGVITLSARSATTAAELASVVTARMNALAKAHSLTVSREGSNEQPTTLHTLIKTIIAPYSGEPDSAQSRASVIGSDISISGRAVTSFALLLHEFATNAAKYGALSSAEGRLDIACHQIGEMFTLEWNESNGPSIAQPPETSGFGTMLAKATVRGQLHGEIIHDWKREGLSIKLIFNGAGTNSHSLPLT